MLDSSELLFALAFAVAAFLAGLLYLRSRSRRTRSVVLGGRRADTQQLRFTCASCSRKFTHSRRTLAARDAGARSFLCKACHTRLHGVLPSPGVGSVQRVAERVAEKNRHRDAPKA